MSNTWVELDLSILGANLRSLRRALTPRTKIIFVVKSNAYGHGMLPVARHAWKCGVKWFAVAHIDEALALRKLLSRAEIIIAGAIAPKDTARAIRHRLIPVIVDEKHAAALAAAASRAGSKLRCHAKVDTGMGRLGFAWKEAGKLLPVLAHRKSLDICGICSHFASVGANPSRRKAAPTKDGREFACLQFDRFRKVVAACEKAGMKNLFKHMSNSGGILCDSAWHMDGVRPGILVYGYGKDVKKENIQYSTLNIQCPSGKMGAKLHTWKLGIGNSILDISSAKTKRQRTTGNGQLTTSPFLSWKTRILQIKRVPSGFPVSYDSTHVTRKPTSIATIDAGYADGYHRALSNKGIVVAGGRRCPVVGRVTMNLVMIDLGPATKVRERDEVMLIGSQGRQSVWASELATLAGTIPYEILTSIRTDERRIIPGK
jgi:alanine racemase